MPVSAWPTVTRDDETPVSGPGKCGHCPARVGQPHASDCSHVVKHVSLRVLVRLGEGNVTRVWRGHYQTDVPHSWDARMIEFYYNDSSWCADNFLGGGADPDPAEVRQWLEAQQGACLCSVAKFEFSHVVDPGPRRRT